MGAWANDGAGSAGGGESSNGRIAPAADELYWYDYQADGTFAEQAPAAPDLNGTAGSVAALPGCGVFGDGLFVPDPISSASAGGLLYTGNTTAGESAVLTVHCWVDLPADLTNSVAHVLVAKMAASSWIAPYIDWGVYITNARSIFFAYSDDTESYTEVIETDEDVIYPGRHHIAFTTDGESATIYLDGEEVASDALANDLVFHGKPILLGGILIGGAAKYSPGRVGELRIIPDRALSAEEIAAIYNGRRTP